MITFQNVPLRRVVFFDVAKSTTGENFVRLHKIAEVNGNSCLEISISRCLQNACRVIDYCAVAPFLVNPANPAITSLSVFLCLLKRLTFAQLLFLKRVTGDLFSTVRAIGILIALCR